MEPKMNKRVSYYLSGGNQGNGKSICLWRNNFIEHIKIARFQNDEAAKLFAKEFDFPLSDALKERIGE